MSSTGALAEDVSGRLGRSYLARLAATLRSGLEALDPDVASRHASALISFQRPNGGFAGRRGGADLYYTAFAVRALHALGKLEGNIAEGVLSFVHGLRPRNAVDALNLLESSMLAGDAHPDFEAVLSVLEELRSPDGGYAGSPGAKEGSTYHTFLAALCYDLAGRTCPDLENIRAFVSSRLCPDGGFSETGLATSSSVNSTAAGVALAQLVGLAGVGLVRGAVSFLLAMRHMSGGWLAFPGSPLADLMSTFTALVSLKGLDALDESTLEGAYSFALTCERTEGGFGAGPWDVQADAEYTYYGLGVLSIAYSGMRRR